jgi:hypothetical protein
MLGCISLRVQFSLKSRESEMRELSAAKQTQRALTAEEIRAFVSGQVADTPGLLAKSPQVAKLNSPNM